MEFHCLWPRISGAAAAEANQANCWNGNGSPHDSPSSMGGQKPPLRVANHSVVLACKGMLPRVRLVPPRWFPCTDCSESTTPLQRRPSCTCTHPHIETWIQTPSDGSHLEKVTAALRNIRNCFRWIHQQDYEPRSKIVPFLSPTQIRAFHFCWKLTTPHHGKLDPHLHRVTTTRKAFSIVGPGPLVVHAVSVSIPQMYELSLSWRRAPPSSRHARQTCRRPQDGIGFSEGTRAGKKHCVCEEEDSSFSKKKKPRLISHVRCPNLYIQAWTQDNHSQIVPCVQHFWSWYTTPLCFKFFRCCVSSHDFLLFFQSFLRGSRKCLLTEALHLCELC